MIVIKRDLSKEEFDLEKVYLAIKKAANDKELPDKNKEDLKILFDDIIRDSDEISVDEIHNLVKKYLIDENLYEFAEGYIVGEHQKDVIRLMDSKLIKGVAEKLGALNVSNQNANVDEYSFGGRMGEANRYVTKDYALNYCMSKKSRKNHLENKIYIHDLDSYAVGMHNCLSMPFDDLLANGFNTRQTDVRPANSINTAFQLVAVLFQLQSLQQFGGVSATHLDWTMVPYVRRSFFKHYVVAYIKTVPEFLEFNLEKVLFDDYEDEAGITRNRFDEWIDENKESLLKELGLEEKDFYVDNNKLDKTLKQSALFDVIQETKQAVEGMYHNLNTLQSRSGNQLPFTSINYGTCTSPEGRLITKALLKGSLKGVGKLHKTPIFPCGIFQYMKGVNDKPDTPNYDLYQLALESTSKRLYPNYANVDWSGNAGYDRNDPRTYFSTMGCRTANGFDINGFGQLKDGRGNICPVTIILPTLAMEAEGDVERFMRILGRKIEEAKDSLIERFEWICKQNPDSAKFMYENHTMAGYVPEEGIRSALKHGTLALGQLGLAETLQILIGCDQTDPEGMKLAKRIESLFRKRCDEYKTQYKLNFGVYFTPAENLCYTALKKFKAKYGVIPNVSDHQFFTNSIHVPVWKEVTPFEKIDLESQLTGYSSAGCITYVELPGTSKHNIEALEEIVNYAMDHDIPYFAINVPNDFCEDCGYTGEFNDKCPVCGSTNIKQLRRVTGYLTGDYKSAFNLGKQDEVSQRVKHIKG